MTGKAMRRARKTLGFSQHTLGDALGLHWNTIARMERGELDIMKQTELALKYLLLVKKTKGEKN
jgi:DNA-binding XRE family transcriptional regulator